ncbi:MAG: hypothetical protein LC114_09975 [Bryobacterales bacterium]|nr:hypothetical protein [Bryobacterales bacterium]
MPPRKNTGVSFVVIAILMVMFPGCARKRRVPLPPPISTPAESSPVTEPGSEAHSYPESALLPPPGCEMGPRPPWLRCVYVSPSGERLRFYLALPEKPPKEHLPVVTVLHGSSNSGSADGKALDGASRFATDLWVRADVQRRHPSIILVPQAEPAPGETWVRAWRTPAAGDSRPKEALMLVMELLGSLEIRYPVDRRRLYLTGQSMGGFGAWLAYTRFPGTFAAIIPVCGGGDSAAVRPNSTAVWAFHGALDTVVPVTRAREMVEAIRAAGSPIRYTEYPDLGHNIFAKVYGEEELVGWLFAQALPDAP